MAVGTRGHAVVAVILALVLVPVVVRGFEPPPARDHYKVLGVPTDASDGQVKKAYRRLARKW